VTETLLLVATGAAIVGAVVGAIAMAFLVGEDITIRFTRDPLKLDPEFGAQILYALERAEQRLRHEAATLMNEMNYDAMFPDDDANRMAEARTVIEGLL